MCLPGLDPVTIGMAMTALGGGAQLINSQQALKRQDRETARGITARSLLQREAGDRVQRQIADVAKSNPDAERRDQNNAFISALREAKVADGGQDIGSMGAVSDRFSADVGQARAGAQAEGQTLSGQLAAIDAPGLQRQREARGFADTATDLSMIGDRANSLDFLTQMRTANAGRTNPMVDALGTGLQAFGQTYAGKAPKKKLVMPSGPLVDTAGWKTPGGF
jgi:hypothetical protein